MGVPLSVIEITVGDIASSLSGAISSEVGRWILGPHRDAQNEYNLCTVSREGRRSYKIDRRFLSTVGTWWIVDYKTSFHEGSNPSAFLDAELDG